MRRHAWVAGAALAALALAADPVQHSTRLTPQERYKDVGSGHAHREQSMTVEAHGRQLQPYAIEITGLNLPTHMTLDDTGAVLISEKAGIIKRVQGWFAQTGPGNVILDISNIVANYGDHGLMSVVVHKGYLWAAFSRETAPWGDYCDDWGSWDGRAAEQIQGCKVYGRISRWPYANGQVTGPEEIVVDGEPGDRICGQFSTHGTTMILVGPGDYLYFSVGDGAAFTAPDVGQMGSNPCNDPPGYLGAFRVQNPDKLNGKIIRLDPDTLQFEIYAAGFRNPFRMMYWGGNLYETDTGWYTTEELNLVLPNHNYGWPCFEGQNVQVDYDYFNHPVCQDLKQYNLATPPLFEMQHPKNAVGNVMAISAVAGWNGRIYLGDYTRGLVFSIAPDGSDMQEAHRDAAPVGLFPTPVGLAYINYDQGAIFAVPEAGVPLPSPSSSPAPAVVVLEPKQGPWTPGQQVEIDGRTNIEGREGLLWEWTISLLFNCRNDGGCDEAQLLVGEGGPSDFLFQTPTVPGTLEITGVAKTYAGTEITGTIHYVSVGGVECVCNGPRNLVDAGQIGGTAPSATPSTSPRPAWGSVAPPLGDRSGLQNIMDNPAALGGIIAAGALVAIGVVIAAAWVTGVPARLGLTSAPRGTTDASSRRAPTGAAAATAGANAALAAGTASAGGARRAADTNGGTSQPSMIASRRPSFGGAPTLQTEAAPVSAAAPNRGITPAAASEHADANGKHAKEAAPASTPSGEKRV